MEIDIDLLMEEEGLTAPGNDLEPSDNDPIDIDLLMVEEGLEETAGRIPGIPMAGSGEQVDYDAMMPPIERPENIPPQEAGKPGIREAIFPSTFSPKEQKPIPMYDRETGAVTGYVMGEDASVMDPISDITSLAARGAGAALDPVLPGDQAEGESFIERMSDPEAGILKPVGEKMQEILADPEAGAFLKTLAKGGEITSDILEDPTVVASLAAKFPSLMGKAIKPLSKVGGASKWGAKKSQDIILSPRARDVKKGFNTENVLKHELTGSVDEVLGKTQLKINDAATRLKNLIKEGNTPDVKIDINQAINEVQRKILKNRVNYAEMSPQLKPAFKKLRQISNFVLGDAKYLDLADAQKFKQQVGSMGEWEYMADARNFQLDPDSKAVSRIASELYDLLKKRIETQAPKGLKEVNKELSELIPIENAARARKVVTDRASVVTLGDMMGVMATIGGGPKGIALWAAIRAQKLGATPKALNGLAKKLLSASSPENVQRFSNSLIKLGVTKAEIDAIRGVAQSLPSDGEEK